MSAARSPVPLWRPVRADPARYFGAELVARGKAYTRPKQRMALVRTIAGAGTLVAIVWSGAVPSLTADWGAPWPLEVFVVMALVIVLISLPGLPSEVWQEFVHEKRWGFSTQTARGYIAHELKELAVFGLVVPGLFVIPLWAFIRSTELWWLWGSIALAAITFLLGVVYPIAILPVFNRFTPLADDELRARLEALARHAGITIKQFLVMDASKRSRKDNAFFVGMGASRRIVLYDTMLSMPHDCIEMVIAHEIGHWRKRHSFWGGVMATLQLPLVLGVTAALVGWDPVQRWADVDAITDPGALPLFFLSIGLVQMALRRGDLWFSRWFERQADHEALELTQDPAVFGDTWRRMVDRNVPDVDPSWWVRTTMSHPPIAQRMAFGEAWAAAHAA